MVVRKVQLEVLLWKQMFRALWRHSDAAKVGILSDSSKKSSQFLSVFSKSASFCGCFICVLSFSFHNFLCFLLLLLEKASNTWMPHFFAPYAWRRSTLARDAMLAGTSHYPYTSSSHDLLSGCKDKLFSLIFQTFGLFFADFSLTLVLQIKTSKIINDMAKVHIHGDGSFVITAR